MLTRTLQPAAIIAVMIAWSPVADVEAIPAPAPETRGSYDHFHSYFQSAIAGDLEHALAHWHSLDRAEAVRLGGDDGAEPPRVDRDSPLWVFMAAIRDSSVESRCSFGPPSLLRSGPFAGRVSIVLTVETSRGRGNKQYLFEPDGEGGWWLVRHERLLAEQGPATPGRFVRVFERRPGASWELPPEMLAELDAVVETMAGRLGLSTDDLARLERGKLHYLLAAPSAVAYVEGAAVAGLPIVPSATVVSSRIDDHAQLARLVIDAWLGDQAPVHTLPLLQEGLVELLVRQAAGGSRPADDPGRRVVLAGEVSLDALAVPKDYRQRLTETARDVAVAFVSYLLEIAVPDGLDAMRSAYLAASANPVAMAGWSAQEIQERLAGSLNLTWDDLSAGFEAWCRQQSDVTDPPAASWH